MQISEVNLWLFIAGVLSLVTCLIHAIMGGKAIAKPLREARLEKVTKYTSLYVWYMVTFVLAVVSAGFILASFDSSQYILVCFLVAMCVYFAVLNIYLGYRYKMSTKEMPQWTLFLPIAILGMTGLITG